MTTEGKGKIILLMLVPFFLGGFFQGINDAIFANNSMFNLFFGLYMGCSTAGLDVSWIPALIPTSGYLNPIMGTVTTATFLIGIFVCIITGEAISQKYRVYFSKKEKIAYFFLSVLVFSATWDMTFMIILFNIWTPEVLTSSVDWLPPLTLGIVEFKIGFTWEFGVWFIFSRFLLASYLTYYLALPRIGGEEKIEYY